MPRQIHEKIWLLDPGIEPYEIGKINDNFDSNRWHVEVNCSVRLTHWIYRQAVLHDHGDYANSIVLAVTVAILLAYGGLYYPIDDGIERVAYFGHLLPPFLLHRFYSCRHKVNFGGKLGYCHCVHFDCSACDNLLVASVNFQV